MALRRAEGRQGMLFSRIEVSAELKGSASAIKRELQAYHGLRLVREGTVLAYEIVPDDDEHHYSVEFGTDKIALCIYSRKTPMLFIREALLRLVALLQLTSCCYDVGLHTLYPYLVLALAGEQLSSLKPETKAQNIRAASIVLAKRLVRLISENRDTKKENVELASKLHKTILKTIAISGRSRIDAKGIASELGIEESDITDALATAGDAGYKVANYGDGAFSLVKSWQA
jgi:hypothetical protein